ncbi:hypothetical protein [Pantoea agglomerans]|uniref:hypothetical protein n=1 Tax=Enterobacter agglomerans TaxID=549 RepID=UPI00177EFE38|nr:hypothetical protein [Pantoea agglomerans]MBD8249958.1 hypothetical protein [Pantoea agglomerans]
MRKGALFVSAITIMSIVLPFIVLLIYRNQLTGNPFELSLKGLSNKNDDWSAFGSLVSGLFTWSGALSTLAALLFAFRQNKKLAQEATERSAQDKVTAEKNIEFMDFQRERINFEKFRIHQQMFDELLDKLEIDAKGDYHFNSRSLLYKNIFPENSFSVCHTKISDTSEHVGSFNDILVATGFMRDKLKNDSYVKNAQELIHDIAGLQEMLMLNISRSAQPGDLIFGNKYVIFNVVELYSTFILFSKVINAISAFGQLKKTMDLASHVNLPQLVLSLSKYTSVIPRIKTRDPSFPFEYIPLANLKRIIALYNNFNLDSKDPLHIFFKIIPHMILDALSPHSIHNTVTDKGLTMIIDSILTRAVSATTDAELNDTTLRLRADKLISNAMDIKRGLANKTV